MIAEIAKGEYNDMAIEGGETSNQWTISIRKEGFSGTVLEFNVSQPALIEYFGNDEDVFDPVKSSRCTFGLIGINDEQDKLLLDIAQSELLTYGVVIYRGSQVEWRGWIYPEQSNKDLRYRSSWFFEAGDALALLDSIPEPSAVVSITGIIQQLFIDPTTDQKNGISFGKLYEVVPEVAVYMHYEWAYWRKSDAFANKMYDYNAYIGLNYYEILAALLRANTARICQSQGVYQIIHLPSYQKQYNVARARLLWDASTSTLEYPSPSFTDSVDVFEEIGTVHKSAANFRYQPAFTEQQYLINQIGETNGFSFRATNLAWNNQGELPFGTAVYSNNSSQFTVQNIIYDQRYATNIMVFCTRSSGSNDPTSTGTLTRISGTGPSSITFTQVVVGNGQYNENYGIDVKNTSYYIDDIDLLPFISKQQFNPPQRPLNGLGAGGINIINDKVLEGITTLNVYMYLSKLELVDIMPNGQDMTSGWTIQSSNTTSAATTLGRNVSTTVDGTLTNIYQEVTGLETSTNYVLIAESFGASVVNSTYEAFIATSQILGSFPNQGVDVLQGGLTGLSLDECGYYFCRFNTGANADWYIQLLSRLGTSDSFEWGNIRLFKENDLNQSIEDLLVQTKSDHKAFSRRIYNILERSNTPFIKMREFGNEYILPHSLIWNTKRREQQGSWVNVKYNQAASWETKPTFEWVVGNNGQPNNSLTHQAGAATNQIEVLETIRQGAFTLAFKIFASDVWFSELTPRYDIGIYKEEDGPVGTATAPKYGFRVTLTQTSPTVRLEIQSHLDGLQNTVTRTLSLAPGGARSELFKLFYDGAVLHFIYDDTVLYSGLVDFQDTTETLRYVKNIVFVNGLRRTLTLEGLTLQAENLQNIQSFY